MVFHEQIFLFPTNNALSHDDQGDGWSDFQGHDEVAAKEESPFDAQPLSLCEELPYACLGLENENYLP